MRETRRKIIQNHMWITRREYPWQFDTYNLRLCVRLYERQFYGRELAYASIKASLHDTVSTEKEY